MANTNRLTNKLKEYFKENIKLTFVNENEGQEIEDILEESIVNETTILIVTKDDKVYVIKLNLENTSFILLSRNDSNIESFIVESLCYKGIIDFKNSSEHMVARTIDGKIYCWGDNFNGALGNGKDDENYYKPELNQYLSDEHIIDICCGDCHSLALTSNGEVYAWGLNEDGQIGNESDDECQPIPIKLNGFDGEKVTAISCGFSHSMAFTESSRVFSWGSNEFGQLGIGEVRKSNTPKLVRVDANIKKISCGQFHSLLLSCDGSVYAFGSNLSGQLGNGNRDKRFNPTKINNSNKFIDIATHYLHSISIALTEENKVYGWGCYDIEPDVIRESIRNIIEPEQIKFKSFEEFFEKYLQLTYKPIDKILDLSDNYVQPGRYDTDLEAVKELGRGSYGQVIQVKYKNSYSDESYAIKIMKYKSNKERELLKELKIYFTINNFYDKRIVVCFDAWLENTIISENRIKREDQPLTLYMLMELCDNTLEKVIEELHEDENLSGTNYLTTLGYYIANYILIEILKGVQYLHKRRQIIHRDLKPDNILLKKEMSLEGEDRIFVKIGDFGLITIHKFVEQTHSTNKGDINFMAPEIEDGIQYNTKADIYSLGVISQQLFNIDSDRDFGDNVNESLLMSKYKQIQILCERMTQNAPNNRPDCEEIINQKNLWALHHNQFDSKKEFENYLEQNKNKNQKTILYHLIVYLKSKLTQLKKRDFEADNQRESFNFSKKNRNFTDL